MAKREIKNSIANLLSIPSKAARGIKFYTPQRAGEINRYISRVRFLANE